MMDQCRLIDLPPHHDVRGNLSVIEGGIHIPFDIKRVYYLYDVPGGSARAGHGHIELQQLFVAMSGSFDVIVDDGYERKKFQLNRSYYGLYVPGMMWREVENFSSGAVCVVLASTLYDKNDYFHNYQEFVAAAHQHKRVSP
ncbi:FdtA/QdtA family cupin domain-containing protein [Pseudoduganella danionis]|uniref:WxcM-like domain-containing protein n=1 Tax=Pseudoduganella danionis TaxID=1890295 RepID=A0ABW9STX3_9BURK|nr:FdtA/QdtA family cupin domain-containing protein [Pseudoduganella danionis]MTW35090.1 WxcM-like domain-containing protein [Pseudoduganella danionis]